MVFQCLWYSFCVRCGFLGTGLLTWSFQGPGRILWLPASCRSYGVWPQSLCDRGLVLALFVYLTKRHKKTTDQRWILLLQDTVLCIYNKRLKLTTQPHKNSLHQGSRGGLALWKHNSISVEENELRKRLTDEKYWGKMNTGRDIQHHVEDSRRNQQHVASGHRDVSREGILTSKTREREHETPHDEVWRADSWGKGGRLGTFHRGGGWIRSVNRTGRQSRLKRTLTWWAIDRQTAGWEQGQPLLNALRAPGNSMDSAKWVTQHLHSQFTLWC